MGTNHLFLARSMPPGIGVVDVKECPVSGLAAHHLAFIAPDRFKVQFSAIINLPMGERSGQPAGNATYDRFTGLFRTHSANIKYDNMAAPVAQFLLKPRSLTRTVK